MSSPSNARSVASLWLWQYFTVSSHCGLKSYSRRLDILLSPLRKKQLCLNKDAGDGNICYQKDSKCYTMGGRREGYKVRRQTLLHVFFWLISSTGLIPPKSLEVRKEPKPSNDSLRSAQLPKVETGMFELAYETAKGVNIHFYLLSKLFMSISPPLYAETNTWRNPEPERWINKDFVTVSCKLLLCAA